MFICRECGSKFEIKPQYCECGNDVFEEVVEREKEKFSFVGFLQKYNISLFAFLFFVTCLVLSILVLLFFANPTTDKNNSSEHSKPILVQNNNIPSLDSFWDNTPVKQEKMPVAEETIVEIVEVPTVVKVIETKNTKTIQPKSDTVNKPKKNIQTTVVNNNVSNSQNVVKSANPQVVMNYKIKLRNALFSKLNIAAISGDGKCGIEFSVNSNGKLINRAFSYQSDNKSLNDEVYKMMMRLPVFDVPPSDYNGEIIKITFELKNGSYEMNIVH